MTDSAPAVERLSHYPDYIDDRDGLERFRRHVLSVQDRHDMAPVNCNSLARLVMTIDNLEAEARRLAAALIEDRAEIQKLAQFFCTEERGLGFEGDAEGRSTVDSALKMLREQKAALTTAQEEIARKDAALAVAIPVLEDELELREPSMNNDYMEPVKRAVEVVRAALVKP